MSEYQSFGLYPEISYSDNSIDIFFVSKIKIKSNSQCELISS